MMECTRSIIDEVNWLLTIKIIKKTLHKSLLKHHNKGKVNKKDNQKKKKPMMHILKGIINICMKPLLIINNYIKN
jgi:hypothetical protein